MTDPLVFKQQLIVDQSQGIEACEAEEKPKVVGIKKSLNRKSCGQQGSNTLNHFGKKQSFLPDGSEIRVVLNGLEIVDKSLLSHSLNGNVVKASSEATVPEAIFKGLSAVEAIETTPQAELLEPSHVQGSEKGLERKPCENYIPAKTLEKNQTEKNRKMSKVKQKQLKMRRKQQEEHEDEGDNQKTPIKTEECQEGNYTYELGEFMTKFQYLFRAGTIEYPVEDSFFVLYPSVCIASPGSLPTTNDLMFPHVPDKPLPRYFAQLVSLWNQLKQYGDYLQVSRNYSLEQLESIINDENSELYWPIFVAGHRFFMQDLLYHKLDEFQDKSYHLFLSLMRYSHENGFYCKVLRTCWPKFSLLIVNMQLQHIQCSSQRDSLNRLKRKIQARMDAGNFGPFTQVDDRLEYLNFLFDFSLQTIAFRNLIDEKLETQRHTQRTRHELLERRKALSQQVLRAKEDQRQRQKSYKKISKTLKKQIKNTSSAAHMQALVKLDNEKQNLQTKITSLQQQINQVLKSAEELGNAQSSPMIQLLGRDRNYNLYWVLYPRNQLLNDYPDRIYVEASCGRWTYYQLDEIDRLQGQLNLRGVREAKLHEKINLALRNNPMKLGEPRTSQEQPERQKQSVLGQHHEPIPQGMFDYTLVSSFDMATISQMIILGEEKMNLYLQQRNARWTSLSSKQLFVTYCQLRLQKYVQGS